MKESTATRIKQIMSKKNLKQVDILRLAEPYCSKYRVKLNKNDLSQYVSGKVQPKQDKLKILALALNVSEPWLMGFNLPMNRLNAEVLETNLSDESKLLDEIQSKYGSSMVQVVQLFKSLNDAGKQKALENLSDLTEINKYKR